jgi:hypothetical protein
LRRPHPAQAPAKINKPLDTEKIRFDVRPQLIVNCTPLV